MKSTTLLILVSSALALAPALADEVVITTNTNPTRKTSTINASTIGASTVLSPGRYMTTVAPGFDGAMAGRLKKAFAGLTGLSEVEARPDDSTIRFTVKEGARLRVADVERTVAKADASAVASTPILESSLKNRPGI